MILFTADIHFKLGQKNVPKVWAKNRYNMFLDQLDELQDGVDIHVIGGDIFDRLPTLDELELYFDLVERSKVPTYIYDGNHEATKKGQTFLSALKVVTKLINPLVTIVDDVTEFEWGTILPYCALHRKNVIEGLNTNKPLFTHVRGEIPPHVKPEIDLAKFANFKVVFAGDLHAHSNSQLNIVYPGSPMTTSFHRSEVETGVIVINEHDESWVWHALELPQLIRKTVTDPAEMVKTDYHHTIYEVEGDLGELAGVKNSDLLDKKVVRRSVEATLLLDPNMTIEQELAEYLLYILELPEDKVSALIGTFHDNHQDA